MVGLWMVAVLALVAALAALLYARHTAQRLAHLSEMYWQLKFDHGELKAKVEPPKPAADPQATFVPLTRLRSASAPESFGGTGSPGEAGSTQA